MACPQKDVSIQKWVIYFTPSSIFMLSVCPAVGLFFFFFISNLTCTLLPELNLLESNCRHFITMLLDCHLQAHV